MNNRVKIVILSGAVACLLMLGQLPAQDDDEQPRQVDGSFVRTVGNGLVYVEVRSDQAGTKSKFMLEGAEIHAVGDQAIVVGTVPATRAGTSWTAGLRHWLPMSNVTGMLELESKEDFAERVKASRQRPGAKREGDAGDDDKAGDADNPAGRPTGRDLGDL